MENIFHLNSFNGFYNQYNFQSMPQNNMIPNQGIPNLDCNQMAPNMEPTYHPATVSYENHEFYESHEESEACSETKKNKSPKRGKYVIYSEKDKEAIVEEILNNGLEVTFEKYAKKDKKLTKRKLRSWLKTSNTEKQSKGRKVTDPNRDQFLFNWCQKFIKENGRTPTRKETAAKALELNEHQNFKASKGWLDKFGKKYKIEYTPLKSYTSKPFLQTEKINNWNAKELSIKQIPMYTPSTEEGSSVYYDEEKYKNYLNTIKNSKDSETRDGELTIENENEYEDIVDVLGINYSDL